MKRKLWCIFVQFFLYMYVSHCGEYIYSEDLRGFKCPLDPLTDRYPDPTDPTCTRYFLCHLGHAFPRRCGVRRAFHPTLKECYPRYQVPEDVCALPVECEYNGYMSDPDDCTKYYICFFHQAIHYSCLTNYYFDTQKSLCVKDKKKSDACSKPQPLKEPQPEHFRPVRTKTDLTLQRLPQVENSRVILSGLPGGGGTEVEGDDGGSYPLQK